MGLPTAERPLLDLIECALRSSGIWRMMSMIGGVWFLDDLVVEGLSLSSIFLMRSLAVYRMRLRPESKELGFMLMSVRIFDVVLVEFIAVIVCFRIVNEI